MLGKDLRHNLPSNPRSSLEGFLKGLNVECIVMFSLKELRGAAVKMVWATNITTTWADAPFSPTSYWTRTLMQTQRLYPTSVPGISWNPAGEARVCKRTNRSFDCPSQPGEEEHHESKLNQSK